MVFPVRLAGFLAGAALICVVAGLRLALMSGPAAFSASAPAATLQADDQSQNGEWLRAGTFDVGASAPGGKADNITNNAAHGMRGPLTGEAGSAPDVENAFLKVAFAPPRAGHCDRVEPDGAYVKEMLVNVSSIGEKGGPSYQRRVALVVGNGSYKTLSPRLKNPPKDAVSMARMLGALGFTVYRVIDADTDALDACVSQFSKDLEKRRADVALFYYAGHGVQLTSEKDGEKRNYMLAVDAKVDAGKAYGFRQVDAAIAAMRANAEQSVFLYDACRSPPVEKGIVKEANGETVRQAAIGAAAVTVKEADAASQSGIFIAYATSPNRTADDAWGPKGSDHSPFADALLKNMPTPGATIDQTMAQAFNTVGELTDWKQTPWTNSSLTTKLQLNGRYAERELTSRLAGIAANSAQYREQGLRAKAIAEALKGTPSLSTLRKAEEQNLQPQLYKAFTSSKRARDIRRFYQVKISPNGRLIVALTNSGLVDSRMLMIWDQPTGELLGQIPVDAADFAFLGNDALAFDSDEKLNVVDLSSRALQFSIDVSNMPMGGYARHGELIWRYGSSEFEIWKADAGDAIFHLTPGNGDAIDRLTLSRNGQVFITTMLQGGVYIGSVATGDNLTKIPVSDAESVDISSNGKFAAILQRDGACVLWDIKRDKQIESLKALTGRYAIGFEGVVKISPDENYIVITARNIIGGTDQDRYVGVWRLQPSESVFDLESAGAIHELQFSPDGQWLLIESDNEIQLYETASGVKILNRKGASGSFTDDGVRFLAQTENGRIEIFNLYETLPVLEGHEDGIWNASYSPDGKRIVTASGDGTAKIWDASSGRMIRSIQSGGREFMDAGFLSGGKIVATAGWSEPLTLWDSTDGASIETFEPIGIITSFAVNRNQTVFVTVMGEGSIGVFRRNIEAPILNFADEVGNFLDVAYFPDDERIIATSMFSFPTIWDSKSGAQLSELADPGSGSTRVTFSPDGSKFAIGYANATAVVYDASTLTPLQTLGPHGGIVTGVSFSCDGRRIATSSADGFVRLWDTISGSELRSFLAYSGDEDDDFLFQEKLNSVEFSPDCRHIATASGNGYARVWDVGIYGQTLIDAAYALLTDEQRTEVERERVRYWPIDPTLLQ